MADNSFLNVLKARFDAHMHRHPGMIWEDVAARLSARPVAVQAIQWMEETGGEPDVIGIEDGLYLIADCAAESPAGRRSLCYDDAALQARKKNPPAGSAEGQARAAGVAMMTEAQYCLLQSTGEYPHMKKRGSRYLRYALFNATKFVCNWDPSFAAYLAKKRSEGKHYNVAISHAAKKLVRLIFALMKSGKPYCPAS